MPSQQDDIVLPPRTTLWQTQMQILKQAESGDLGSGILSVRKAGTDFIKSFIKDVNHGPTNVAKKLRKIITKDTATWKTMPSELQTRAKHANDAFIEAQDAMESLASSCTSWTASTVQEGANETLRASGDLSSAHEAIASVINDINMHKSSLAKEKQAEGRLNRRENKRMLKPFEATKVPVHWRTWLLANELVLDTEGDNASVTPASTFGKYRPSEDAQGEFTQDTWTVPNRQR